MAKIRETATVNRARILSFPGVPDRDLRSEALTSPTRPATVGTLVVWFALAVWLTPGLPGRPGRGLRPAADEAARLWGPRPRAAARRGRRSQPRECCGRSGRCQRCCCVSSRPATPGNGPVLVG